MTRTDRLRPVVQHTDKREQEALQEVAKYQGMLEIEESRLEELRQYKVEYLNDQQQDMRVYSALELQELNRFLDQLDETIARQEVVIGQRRDELEKRRTIWKAVRVEAKAMQKAVEKLQRQETRVRDRNEQKELDDITQTNFHLRRR